MVQIHVCFDNENALFCFLENTPISGRIFFCLYQMTWLYQYQLGTDMVSGYLIA